MSTYRISISGGGRGIANRTAEEIERIATQRARDYFGDTLFDRADVRVERKPDHEFIFTVITDEVPDTWQFRQHQAALASRTSA